MRHPKSVYLREADLLPPLDRWIAELFDPANLDTTCAQLVTLTNSHANNDEIAKAHHVIRECDLALHRYRAVLEQGANPETVGHWINGATAKKTAAKQHLQQLRQYDDVATLRPGRSASWSNGSARSSMSSPLRSPPSGQACTSSLGSS